MVAGVAAVLGALAIWGRYAAEHSGWLLALDLAVGVLAVGLLGLRWRRPVAVTLVIAALTALSPAATPAATLAVLHVARWRRYPAALLVAAAGVVGQALLTLWRNPSGLSGGWWLVLVAASYAALVGWGAFARANAALLDSYRERARRAEAEQGRRVAQARILERTRIAREMHDVLAHRLSLLALYAGALEYRPDASPAQLAQAATVVRDGAQQALAELREVITVLRDGDADGDSDSGGRPQPGLTDLPRLVEESRAAGMRIEAVLPTAESGAGSATVGRTAYRVVQEGLTNARRHAAGQPVRLRVAGEPGDQLVIDLRNPLPEEVPHKENRAGTGLVGLTERVALVGGVLDHEATRDGEFHLHATIPWPA